MQVCPRLPNYVALISYPRSVLSLPVSSQLKELQKSKMAFSVVSTPAHFHLPKKITFRIRCCAASSAPSVETRSKSIQFDLKTYWTTLIADINQKLNEAVPVRYPEQIYESMRYSVLADGAKRASPVMCVAACELFGGNRLAAFPTACALEMVRIELLFIEIN